MTALASLRTRLTNSPTTQGALAMGAYFVIARALTMVTQFAAGRTLGPDEFGMANLAIATSAYLQIAFMLGFHTAMSHFLAAAPKQSQASTLTTILVGFLSWLAASYGLFRWSEPAIAGILGLPQGVLRQAGFLAVLLSLHSVLASVMLGQRRFAMRGAFEALYGAGTLVTFLVLYAGPRVSHRALVDAMLVSLAGSALLLALKVRPFLTTKMTRGLIAPSLSYAAAASVNVFAAASVTAPARLTAHASGGAASIGVMSAYFVSSIQPALALAFILSSFIVPYASNPTAFERSLRLARRFAAPTALVLFVGFFSASFVGLKLFGSLYPFRADWSALFALAAVAHVGHTLGTSLLAARGLSSLQLSVAGTVLAAVVTTGLSVPLVARFGPGGGAAALICGYACSLLFLGWALSARPAAPAERNVMAVEP